MKSLLGYCTALTLFSPSLFASIELVRVQWNPIHCKSSCEKQLEKKLDKFQAISNYNLNIEKGTALLSWKARQKFDYIALRRSFQSYGLTIDPVVLRVSGTIEKSGSDYFLRSTGDETRFQLLSPQEEGKTALKGNPKAYPLKKEMVEKLDEAIAQQRLVQVDGLFLFFNYRHFSLVIEDISFSGKNLSIKTKNE